jgi:gamma-glutamyltranspeptidase/glutathione hydrolase
MAATSQVLATQVAVEILRQSGTAVDAAIAANAMLSLTEPHMCGPGGDLFAIVWDPKEAVLNGLNASGRSPRGLSLQSLREAIGPSSTMPLRGPLALTVPGAVDGWCALHERFGRLSLDRILRPAIEYARAGVPIARVSSQWWRYMAAELSTDVSLAGRIDDFWQTFMIDGRAPRPGEVIRNPGLARTLEAVASEGRSGFYAGEIGDELSAYIAAAGGHLTPSDLAAPSADWVTPITTAYRGYDVHELPPNGQGLSVLQMLNVLEGYPVDRLGFDNPDYWHLWVETKKLVYEDRARYYADPDFSDIPVVQLLSKDYARRRAVLIEPSRVLTDMRHGEVRVPGGDTTYLATADRDGMMVSLIQSIYRGFGTGLVPPGLGFALQSRGASFALDPAHANVFEPAKRPFHTIIPAFVTKDGRPWISFGVMGADMQPQGQVQVLVNLIDFDMDLQAAGETPRLQHVGGSSPDGAAAAGAGTVFYEPGFPQAVVDELGHRGHAMQTISDPIACFVGGYQAVMRDPETSVYHGASEPRFDGCALGF